MKKITIKNKQEFLFWTIAVVLMIGIISFVSYAVSFIAENLNTLRLGERQGESLIVHFKFDTLEQMFEGRYDLPQAEEEEAF